MAGSCWSNYLSRFHMLLHASLPPGGEITLLCHVWTLLTWQTVYHMFPDSSQNDVSLKLRETEKLHIRCELFCYPIEDCLFSLVVSIRILRIWFIPLWGLLLVDVKGSWHLQCWSAIENPKSFRGLYWFGDMREGMRAWGCGWVLAREIIANSAHLEYMRLWGMQQCWKAFWNVQRDLLVQAPFQVCSKLSELYREKAT